MYRLVVADDSKTIQKVVQLSFAGEEEYQVDCFANGPNALEHIRRMGANVLLVDVSLPLLDGYELCREIRQDPRTHALPVVMLAGSLDPFDQDQADKVGCSGVLTKPFETSQLVRLVEDLIQQSEEEDQEISLTPASPLSQDEPAVSVDPVQDSTLVSLEFAECRPNFSPLPRSDYSAEPLSGGLSQDQFDELVEVLSRRLPDAVRTILAEVSDSRTRD